MAFSKVLVEAQPIQSEAEVALTDSVEFFQDSENQNRWRVELSLGIHGSPDGTLPPYTGEIEVIGNFVLKTKKLDTSAMNLVRVNGPAMLYSAARELFASITSRGPNAAILLPSISFIDLKVDEPAEVRKTEVHQQS
jgi:preprotein translocase subunit SecB